jgi:hypothetical protein
MVLHELPTEAPPFVTTPRCTNEFCIHSPRHQTAVPSSVSENLDVHILTASLSVSPCRF